MPSDYPNRAGEDQTVLTFHSGRHLLLARGAHPRMGSPAALFSTPCLIRYDSAL
jgi:hypothetical protein